MLPRTKHGRSLAALSFLPLLTTATNLPYNPTRIHLTSQPDGKNRAFIIQPGSDSTVSAQLSVLDLSDSIAASSPSPKALSSSLPFLSKDAATAYTSFLDAGGNITVLAGDCTQGVDGATLWRLTPDASAQNGGSWSKDKIAGDTQAGVTGANFLNTAIAFSEVVKGNVTTTDLYAFGGMCPDAGASDANWVSNAAYNNDMVTFSPQELVAGEEDYNVAPVTSKGPPIAEAGMSMTALSPSFSNSSGVQTQQQDFVVLGGHTQNAFINMSQVALFSLPQAIWSFLPVQQPAGASSVSSPGYVTPRSGHSAVLSEDGRSIIVFGGWVGDINTPATPQLVVLQIGSGYGGSGNWQWTPVSTPSGSFSGTPGIYGHGAVMLPGNVMMIMGGYSISTSASRRLARRDTTTQNPRTFLYNVTSNAWLTSYSAPVDTSENQSSGSSSGSLSTPSQKAGVGVGVTFGVFALVGVGGLYAWNSKRSKRRRVNRDSTAFNLVEDKASFDEGWNNHTLTGGRENTTYGYDAGSPTREAFPWLPELNQSGWKSQQAPTRDISSTGAFLNIPSPTRGLRRSSSGRNYQYQPTPAEDPRMSTPINGIHPIVETDEEGYASNASSRPGTADAQKRLLAAQTIFDSKLKRKRPGTSDGENPFADPQPNPLGSHPVSPDLDNNPSNKTFQGLPPTLAIPASVQNRNTAFTSVQDWASAREYNDARSSTGRSSPTKSSSTEDRTLSNLSDMSSRSYQSARSLPRTGSQRSQVPFGFAGVSRITPQPSPQEERTFSFESSGRHSPQRGLGRNRSVTSPTRTSYHRPQLSLDQLRNEGEIALGGTLEQQRQAINRPPSSLYSHEERSMSPAPTSPARRRMNWVGSLRKALGTYTSLERSGSAASIHPIPPLDIPSYTDRSTTPSPTRNRPQRTASDSSAFLRLKRGKDDWTPGRTDGNAWEPYRDDPDPGDWGDVSPVGVSSVRVVPQEDEWDVENAANKRDVQVMFTVPKARLRVVNADPSDRASTRSVSEGSRRSGKSPALPGEEFKRD